MHCAAHRAALLREQRAAPRARAPARARAHIRRPPRASRSPRLARARAGALGGSNKASDDGAHGSSHAYALQPPRTPQGVYMHDQYGFSRDVGFGDGGRRGGGGTFGDGPGGAYSGNRLTASYSHAQYGPNKGGKRF